MTTDQQIRKLDRWEVFFEIPGQPGSFLLETPAATVSDAALAASAVLMHLLGREKFDGSLIISIKRQQRLKP